MNKKTTLLCSIASFFLVTFLPKSNAFPPDTIVLTLGTNLEKFVLHTMQPKETLFSIAKFYGLSVNDLSDYNQALGNRMTKIGTQLKIPIPNSAILRYQTTNFSTQTHIPVVYTVRKGETLYRIAQKYFRMPVDSLRFRNNIYDFTIKEGQQLIIGWMLASGIPKESQMYGNTKFKMDYLLEKHFKSTPPEQIRTERGVAVWQNNGDTKRYALHNDAPINSVVAVTNPMNNRTVFVKIIGKIPPSAYRSNETIVLSSQAAQTLAARDARFMVEIRYQK